VYSPALQDAGLHTWSVPVIRHAPAPSQVPSLPHSLLASTAQLSCGSVPAFTALQMPELCVVRALEHAMHFPSHSVLQQVPSTQKPEVHSAAPVQESPSIFLAAQRWFEALQYDSTGQSLAVEQGMRQPSMSSQATKPQLVGLTALHAPLPSQVEAGVKFPSLQKPLAQT
jgi:hypothetical protein